MVGDTPKLAEVVSYRYVENAGLFEMIVGVLTTCHTQYTLDFYFLLFNRTTLQVFVTYLTGALLCAPFVILQTSTR